MAQIETWYKQDIKKAVQLRYINGNLFSQDNQGNRVGVEVFDGDTPVALSGTVTGNFIRGDGATVAITGAYEENRAYVVIPSAAYAVPGTFSLTVKITDGGNVTTLLAVSGTVYRSSTDVAVDPGTIIQDVNALIDLIQTTVATIPTDYSSLYSSVESKYYALSQENMMLVPCAWIRGSRTNTGLTEVTHRITSAEMFRVSSDTKYTVAEGFRVRRYWYDSSGTIVNFDGSWKTETFTLSPDYQYMLNIARVEENTSEIADITEFSLKVYEQPKDDFVSRGVPSGDDYENLISNLVLPGGYNILTTADWNDLPSDANNSAHMLFNLRATSVFTVQLLFSASSEKRVWYRVFRHTTGSIVLDWTEVTSADNIPNVRVLAVGDSICRGGRNAGKGYVGELGVTFINMGVGGATLSSIHSAYNDSIHHYSTADNIPNQLTTYQGKTSTEIYETFGVNKFTPDVILAEGGINDYILGAGTGTLSATPVMTDAAAAALDRNTLYGALEYLFYQMIKLYPKAQRVFVITHKTGRPSGNYYPALTQAGGYTQKGLHDAIVSCCKLYGVVVADVYENGLMDTGYGVYRSSEEDYHDAAETDYCDYDGVHPLSYGYTQVYVPIIRAALMTATRK